MKQQIITQVPQSDQENEAGSNVSTPPLSNPQPYMSSLLNCLCQCFRWTQTSQQTQLDADHQQPMKIPDQTGSNIGKKTLVLDLDETLVHSSFSAIPDPDIQFNLNLDGQIYTVFVKIRPGTFDFIRLLAMDYEIFIYTASIQEVQWHKYSIQYAEPVIDFIDPDKLVAVRLFRENCTFFKNVFVKDLSTLNRPIRDIVIVDNSPNSFMFQPMNAFHIKNYFDDPKDQELFFLVPFLKLLKEFYDVRPVHEWWYKFINFERFQFTNTEGQKVVYQLRESDFEFEDSEPLPGSNPPKMTSPLDTPKSEQIPLNPTQPLTQKSQVVHPNREFLVELEERMGLSTEGNEISNPSRDHETDAQIRQEININSPKESLKKQIIFPEGPSREVSSQVEYSSY